MSVEPGVPWWAFWRRRPPSVTPDGSSEVTGSGELARRAAPASSDEDDADVPASGSSSGASPDAGLHPLPPLRGPGKDPELDRPALVRSGADVADLVRALLAGEPARVRALREARDARPASVAASATAALAARLPALSGVTGPAAAGDEEPGDLLRAYAALLTARSESRRRRLGSEVTREQLAEVAQTAAAAAPASLGGAGSGSAVSAGVDDLLRWCSTGLPAPTQLVAACLLLAQTADDGGGGPDQLPGEIAELFG